MAAKSGSGYRWLILITLVVGTGMLNYANMVFSSSPVDMMARFNMSQAQLTAISTIGTLPGAFFSIILGNYFDKHGAKHMRFVAGALLILAAAFMMWRAFATNYIQLVIITFVAGTLFLPTQVLPFKVMGMWFNRKQMSVGMGIYGAAAGFGIMLAFALGNVFPNTTAALVSCAVGYLLAALLWLLFVQVPADMEEAPAQEASAQEAAPKVSAGSVLRSKTMWLVMICSLIACSAPLLFNSYIVNAFLAKGMAPAMTSMLAVVFNIALVLGAILAGTVAGKVGRYNGVYFVCCVLGGVCLVATYVAPVGILSFVFLACAGLISAGSLSLNFTRINLIPLTGEFGPECTGIAGGMNNTAMGLGQFFMPTLVAAALGSNYLSVFLVILVLLCIIGFVGRFAMPELGEKGKLAQAAKAEGQAQA